MMKIWGWPVACGEAKGRKKKSGGTSCGWKLEAELQTHTHYPWTPLPSFSFN
ncbi:uncharacterized protein G2W53_002341 [Senna tora]|uniref:Uncharacterized protein n=1 Tax=Senna tora TaxID=362788 RepID=A0A834XKC0_9FABA|nr:uncharacterized protein G2W53_002341 [Senna tora]